MVFVGKRGECGLNGTWQWNKIKGMKARALVVSASAPVMTQEIANLIPSQRKRIPGFLAMMNVRAFADKRNGKRKIDWEIIILLSLKSKSFASF